MAKPNPKYEQAKSRFNRDDSLRHIEAITRRHNAVMNFRTIPESEEAVRKLYSLPKESLARVRLKFRGTFDEVEESLRRRNVTGHSIYFTPNITDGKGTRKENIIAVRALVADFDKVALPDQWEIVPHIIVETSPGRYQATWSIERTNDIQAAEDMSKRLAIHYGTDLKVFDASHVFRLAGFGHQKSKLFISRIYQLNEFEPSLTLADFDSFLPKLPKRRAPSGSNSVGVIDAKAARLLFQHLDVTALNGNDAWLDFAMALHSSCDGDSEVAELFFEFCMSDSNYANDGDDALNRSRWNSFTADKEGGKTVGTLKKICRSNGIPGDVMFAAFNDAVRDFENA